MRAPIQTVYVNGKFLAQPVTGVQRYAREILHAIDALLGERAWAPAEPFVVLVPRGVAALPELRHFTFREVGPATGSLHVWEQLHLPFAARGATLLNLAGSAPLVKLGQICAFHDAAVFDMPDSFSAGFRNWYRLLMTVQGRLSRRVLTVSRFSLDRLRARAGIDAERLRVVHCGGDHVQRLPADPAILDRLGVVPGRYLLAVGSANPNKNFARLLRAFARIDDPGLRLVVVGGTNAAVFAETAGPGTGTGPADPRVVPAGRLDDTEIKALYVHALAYVFPSIYEGFGLPPLEAMYSGCPALVSRAASIPEICADAAGYFEPTSVDSIRDAMARAVAEPEWLEHLRVAGRERAALFTWRRSAADLLQTLAELDLVVHAAG